MTVRKNPAGGCICELYPNGAKCKLIRKKFATKARHWRLNNTPFKTNPWQEEKEDRCTLKELVDS